MTTSTADPREAAWWRVHDLLEQRTGWRVTPSALHSEERPRPRWHITAVDARNLGRRARHDVIEGSARPSSTRSPTWRGASWRDDEGGGPMVPFGEVPADWRDALGEAASPAALAPIAAFVAAARRDDGPVLPTPERVFRALELIPFGAVRAVILGQDPYPAQEHAEGLAFSVPDTVRPLPPALVNIRTEFKQDTGLALPAGGSLEPWARHGVLLLNAVLTVKAGERGSHRRLAGWEGLTDAIVAAVATKTEPVAFLFWGRAAQAKAGHIRESRHPLLFASHPSPLSARRGPHRFLGSRPFTTADAELERRGAERIDWRLAADPS